MARLDPGLRLSLFGYQRGKEEARQTVGHSPPYITGFGARVARQRCPILRAGTDSLSHANTSIKFINVSHATGNAFTARRSIDSSLLTTYDGDMRIYGIEPDGKFREYVPTPFQIEHEEVILEDWLEENPDGILEDGKLLVIGRQVNTNLGTTIDLLALDRDGNAVVIELKRDRTPRNTLAQALEYASFTEQLRR